MENAAAFDWTAGRSMIVIPAAGRAGIKFATVKVGRTPAEKHVWRLSKKWLCRFFEQDAARQCAHGPPQAAPAHTDGLSGVS
ncbi:MAG: hypothetical protein ACLSE7_07665, partial [Lachnospirales bacterium]